MFRFAYNYIFFLGLISICIVALCRWFFYKEPMYRFSYLSFAKTKGLSAKGSRKKIIFLIRMLLLTFLVFLMGRPQRVDSNSKIHVEGVDMILVLDVSGSMQCFDDIKDQRSRLTIAKQEAIQFIKNRENDPIGLVIFAQHAVSRCPLTQDKKMLQDIINKIELGVINPQGTALGVSLVTAANRLKNSKAKSKIMILLTDGEPTADIDIDPQVALDIVKKLGIKVYTVGIGAEHGGLLNDPVFGVCQMGFKLNKPLLEDIAHQTGGYFFEAKNSYDMKKIYEKIDALEKTEYEATLFTKYEDIYKPLLVLSFLGIFGELLLSTFIWFAL